MTEAKHSANTSEEQSSSVECRACLQIMNTDAVFFNIFDRWTPPWDGMENSIAKELAKLANIQISETDKHSKMICEACHQLLLAASNFTSIVRKSNEVLKKRCNEAKETESKIWPKPIQVDKSLPNVCKNTFDVEIKQEVHSDDEYPNMNGSYDSNMEDMPNLDIVKIEPEEMIQQKPFNIEFTGTLTEQLSMEQLNELNKQNNCNSGNSYGYSDVNIKEEPLSEEDDTDLVSQDMSLECLLCTKSFSSVSGLKAHVIAQHSYKSVKRKNSGGMSPEKKKRKYICAICRRTFTTSTDLMVHETCHNKSVCYGCNESFDTFEQLSTHRLTCKAITSTVTKLKTLDDVLRPQPQEALELRCALCDETFTDVYYMNIHREIHHSAQNGVNFPMKVEALDL